MKELFLCIEYLFSLNSKLDKISRSMENMATKDDVMNLAGSLESVIVNESQEVQTVIGQKVADAVAPLLTQIADLSAQLANGASPDGVVFTQAEVDSIAAQLNAALSSIGAVVTPTPAVVVDKPVDGTVVA